LLAFREETAILAAWEEMLVKPDLFSLVEDLPLEDEA